MIRLFIFVLVRFFITVLVVYLVLTLLKKIIRNLQGRSRPFPSAPQEENRPKVKEEYKDVKDVKFIELPNTQTKNNQDAHS
jgi:hypothetical protein